MIVFSGSFHLNMTAMVVNVNVLNEIREIQSQLIPYNNFSENWFISPKFSLLFFGLGVKIGI